MQPANEPNTSASTPATAVPLQHITELAHELEGVVADVEQGEGFDEVCLRTVKRVRDSLYAARAALKAAPPAEPALPDGVSVQSYRIGDGRDGITVDRVLQPEGADLWAIRRQGSVLNKQGQWEYEPMPSSRDDDFFARCRYATSTEAFAAAAPAAFVISRIDYLQRLPSIARGWISQGQGTTGAAPSRDVVFSAIRLLEDLSGLGVVLSAETLTLGPVIEGGVSIEFKVDDRQATLQLHNHGRADLAFNCAGAWTETAVPTAEALEVFVSTVCTWCAVPAAAAAPESGARA